ncbi:MAG: helix-turn-helix transcriptional regulator [Muribaculaceae bacterium]|nr:helix-turn-helix transcriptional regulator [Muribaculaceae bacterium]MDE6027823.1 helix-turn-helix transcriptional regulator [Muribaculaceae bacterium]
MANFAIIRKLCEEKNISIRELARRINRRESSLQSLIKNGSTSTLTVEAIADVLGVSPGIFWDEQKSDNELETEVGYLRQLVIEKDQRIQEKERMIEFLMPKGQAQKS